MSSGSLPKASWMEVLLGPSAERRKKCQTLRFTDKEVQLAFTRAQQKRFPLQTLGKDPWRVLPRLLCQVLLGVLLFSGIFCLVATIALAPTRSISLSPSGSILDDDRIAASASTTELHPIWNFPHLSLAELRQVEDVLFEHRHEIHVLKVAVTSKLPDGSVILQSADSALRVRADGAAFWRQNSAAEVFLEDMEALRSLSGLPLMGSLLSMEVLQS